MAYLLCLETSTEVCSVALCENGVVRELQEDRSGKNHALLLTRFAERVMKSGNLRFHELDAIAVSGGPGSYTGLRIGVSTAKGLCYATGKPLIAIPSLESMAHHVVHQMSAQENDQDRLRLFCPMIDARRMEVYSAIYDRQMKQVRSIQADIIDHNSFSSFLSQQKMVFFGNGSAKCQSILNHPNALFLDDIHTSAAHIAAPAYAAFLAGKFVNVAYYEPFYLKDFIATVPTKNIFQAKTISNPTGE